MKTTWYWHKNRVKDQWNRIEDPDKNPHRYSHLSFEKGSYKKCWRNVAFSRNVAGKTRCRRLKRESYL
jgi:hypothetical protein